VKAYVAGSFSPLPPEQGEGVIAQKFKTNDPRQSPATLYADFSA